MSESEGVRSGSSLRLSPREAVAYAAAAIASVVAYFLGASVSIALAGQEKPWVVPVWMGIIVISVIVYLLKRFGPRTPPGSESRIDSFFEQS